MRWSFGKVVVVSVAALFALYVGSCSYRSETGQANFKNVHVGDTFDHVLQTMGDPSTVQDRDAEAPIGYGEARCEASCRKRIWYLNRASLMGEAWSFEIDEQGKVIESAYWISP